ncbi:hypothetical protein LINGRAHAP2_LOCUS32500 [Linum grandiflorum]
MMGHLPMIRIVIIGTCSSPLV